MKNRILQLIRPAFVFILMFSVLSCSTEPAEEEIIQSVDFKIEFAESAEEQLAMLSKAMRRFHNFNVALSQGYVQVSPLVPGMGYHFVNPDYVDMEFEILKPEILVYHPDENGVMQFVAAEYLIPVPNCDPEGGYTPPAEGFLGDDDHWHLNCNAGGWTLHAWVGLENENGVFAPFNPALQ